MAQKARADILTRDDLKAYTTWRDKHGWSMTTVKSQTGVPWPVGCRLSCVGTRL